MRDEILKGLGVTALVAVIILGFAGLVVMHRQQQTCPGYSAYQGCTTMGER